MDKSQVYLKVERLYNEAKPTLDRLAHNGIKRDPLAKYCLVTYPPRSASPKIEGLEEQVKISETIFGKVAESNPNADLYIHTAFCSRACSFCNFYFQPGVPNFNGLSNLYVETVEKEVELLREKTDGNFRVKSIYFGGGSPSLLSPEQVSRVMDKIRNSFSLEDGLEISFELHPEIVRLQGDAKSYINGLVNTGVNRFSVSFQSVDDTILRSTKRGHTSEEALRVFDEIRGKERTNIDLMWGFRNQDLDSYFRSLETVYSLGPDSVTTYSLEIRPGSPDHPNYLDLTKEHFEKLIRMSLLTRVIAESQGYSERTFDYWFKNDDFEHMKRKWGGDDTVLLTLGPGTYNWVFVGAQNNFVFYKPYNLTDYIKCIEEGVIPIERASKLNKNETFRRHLMFKMRASHIPKDWLSSRIDNLDENTREEVNKTFRGLISLGVMEDKENRLALSTAGRVLNHETSSLFSSDNVIGTALEKETDEESRYSSFVEPNMISRYKDFIKKQG